MKPARVIELGGLVTVIGLAIAGTAPVIGTPGSSRTHAQQITGGLFVLAGWLLLAYGIHTFGRAGDQ